MGSPTKAEKAEFESRRQRVTNHLLECVTSPEIPDDLMHFYRIGEWLRVHDAIDKVADLAPKGRKDKDGTREILISAALYALRLAADLERVRSFEKA
jgi:hypothetical protein